MTMPGEGGGDFAYCREQKPVFDAICEHVAGHAHQILSA